LGWKKLAISKKSKGLGFRDLRSFNSVLLARQCWRILKNPHSLLYRVLKSKYFPNSSFLDAKILHNPSYAWRSILGAREIIYLGSRWRVGTGEKILIWQDRWIPTRSTFKVQSSVKILPEDSTVDALIFPDTRLWNAPLIDTIFDAPEAAIIKNIPLSRRGSLDTIIWTATKNGVYSVQSAYHLLMKVRQESVGSESSRNFQLNQLWKGIWNAPV
jgi:hypothetical protein